MHSKMAVNCFSVILAKTLFTSSNWIPNITSVIFKNINCRFLILHFIIEMVFEGLTHHCCYSTSHCLILLWPPVCVCLWTFGCVCVCLWWVVNEVDGFALLAEYVVSEGPISPEPQAWLQGPGRTASTDEFVSVIKAHSVPYAGTRQIHT